MPPREPTYVNDPEAAADDWETGQGAGTVIPAKLDEDALQLLQSRAGQSLPWVYGRHLVAGTPIFQTEDADGNTVIFIALGDGPWDGIETLWVNASEVTLPDTSKVHFHPGLDGASGIESVPGTENQQACSFFDVSFTRTTFSRTAYLALNLPPDPMAPTVKFDVRGICRARRMRIFDAAGVQTSFAYSVNAAWQILDAMISLSIKPRALAGAELTDAEKGKINFAVFKTAADYCAATITSGPVRFESHVGFVNGTNLSAILDTIQALCRGYLTDQWGGLALYIDQPRASVFTFTGDNILAASFGTSRKGIRAQTNRLVVKIRDVDSGGADHTKDFAPWSKALDDEISQDAISRIVKEEADYGANTKERAERLGRYWLLRSLIKDQARFVTTLDAGALMPGDVVTGPIDQALINTGLWEILEITDGPPKNHTREVFCQKYDSGICSDYSASQQGMEEGVIHVHRVYQQAGVTYDYQNMRGVLFDRNQIDWLMFHLPGVWLNDCMAPLDGNMAIVVGTPEIYRTVNGGWRVEAVTGNGVCGSAGELGGAVQLATGAGSGSLLGMSTFPIFDPAVAANVCFYAIIDLLATANRTVRIGLGDSAVAEPGNGIYFQFDPAVSSYWQTITRAASTSTTTSPPILGGAGKREFLIVRDSAGAKFYTRVGKSTVWTLLATHTTNIPTAALAVLFQLKTNTGAAAYLNVYHLMATSILED